MTVINVIKFDNKRSIIIQCDVCDKSFERSYKKTIVKHPRHFCDHECYAIARKKGALSYNASLVTSRQRYGVDHPMQSDAIKNRLGMTMLERYGVTNSYVKLKFWA